MKLFTCSLKWIVVESANVKVTLNHLSFMLDVVREG